MDLVANKCKIDPPCASHQLWNIFTNSCQCKPGYTLSSGVCVPISCGSNFEMSPTGVCICVNGYVLVNSSCIQVGSYAAHSPMYNITFSSTFNTSANTQITNYTCGCPAGFKFLGNRCIPCHYLN